MTGVPLQPVNQRLSVCLINARSVRDKTSSIVDHLCEHKLDIVGITETWLSGNDTDDITTHHLTPPGYKLIHVPRTTGQEVESDYCTELVSKHHPVYPSSRPNPLNGSRLN